MFEQEPDQIDMMSEQELRDSLRKALATLNRIADCEAAPDIDPVGDWEQGLHCGVEDVGCADRYEGANYGYSQGMERGLEWAVNEAKYGLGL